MPQQIACFQAPFTLPDLVQPWRGVMIRFGILGTAQITPSALIYPCMNEPNARVTAIAARDRRRAEAFAAAHHIRNVCDSYADVVSHPAINALYNPLHIPAHHPWTIAALKAGKHVLCEKSFACNAAQAAQMNALAKQLDLVVMDAFHYRYHPLFIRAKEIYDSGELGNVESIVATFHAPISGSDNIRMNYELGGGVMMDIGCYPVSWIRHLTGAEPIVTRAHAQVGPPLVDVLLEAEMELPDGMRATASGDMRATAHFKAELIVAGDKGTLTVQNPLAPQLGHALLLEIDGKTTRQTLDRRPTYAYQLDAFIAAVEQGAPIYTDGEDAVAQMRVIDRCYEAAGLPVRGLDPATLPDRTSP
jgi:predicted dehydrogenase